ncbi:MAG TPA: alpha/beta hydrolase [Candidatus Paceibacterota bacterium]
MQQVVVIHGGDSFDTHEGYIESLKSWPVTIENFRARKDWKGSLQTELGPEFDVLQPRMPNKTNARYAEWKIWFERMFPFLQDGVIFVCHSQGAIFLAKYLAESEFPKKIKATFLIAAPHNHTKEVGDFRLGDLTQFGEQCGTLHLYHSKDDPVVPFSEMQVYCNELPQAHVHVFEDRAHFNQETFAELVADIKRSV